MSEFDFSKALITGSNGSLGSYIDFGLRTNKRTLDILDGVAVLSFVKKYKPSVIIHLAAATDTVQCEKDIIHAFQLNAAGTLNVALAAESVGAVMVYVSTSRVFDGSKNEPYTENDVPSPNTVYGRSKYLGELITSLVVSQHIIARGCWMFGGGPLRDDKFYGSIIKQLKNEEIVAIDDVYGSPTYARDFIETIKQLISQGNRGVFNISNSGNATRADIASQIIRITKSETKLKRVNREYFKTGYLLPTNESISSTQVHLRPWQDALTDYLTNEWKGYLEEIKL